MAELHALPTAEPAAQPKAQFVATQAKERLEAQGQFTIALYDQSHSDYRANTI